MKFHSFSFSYIVNSDPVLSKSELDNMRKTLVSPLPNKQTSSQVLAEETTSTKKKKKSLTLPWWCIFIAYGLSFLVVCVSGLFIFARGVEFGDEKTRKWLTSSITGFFSSILITQPVKVRSKWNADCFFQVMKTSFPPCRSYLWLSFSL
jgi:hypothetical protein